MMWKYQLLLLLIACSIILLSLYVHADGIEPTPVLQRRLFSMPVDTDNATPSIQPLAVDADVPAVRSVDHVSSVQDEHSNATNATPVAVAAPTHHPINSPGSSDSSSYHHQYDQYDQYDQHDSLKYGRCPFAFETIQQGEHSGDTVYTAATGKQKVRCR
jgi:hypothetical protein